MSAETSAGRSAQAPERPGGTPPQPLAGIRVIEVSQGIAAPSCGRYLSAYGAEVIKIESRDKLDINRQYAASWLSEDVDPAVRVDTSPLLDEFISDKLSVGVDIGSEEGQEILRRLVTRADVFLVNLSVQAVASLRIGYEDLRELREDIVYVGLPAFGATPSEYREYRAWGPNLAPLAGIDNLTGWPDRPPTGISSFAYPDYVNAGNAAIAVLGAILARDISGDGQYVDFSQYESCAGVLGPTLMDYTANGRVAERAGNRVAWAAPHGVYPVRGEDRWVAISCTTEAHWVGLCTVAVEAGLSSDARWATPDGRHEHAQELDRAIAGWTTTRTAREVAFQLQEQGVPAGMVYDNAGLLTDAQLEARSFYTLAPQSRFGSGLYMRHPALLSATPAKHVRAGASLGEDNGYVIEQLAEIEPERRRELAERGVVHEVASPSTTFRRPYVRWLRHFTPTLTWPDRDGDG